MTESTLFGLAFVLYIVATLFYLAFQFSKKEPGPRPVSGWPRPASTSHTAALILRTFTAATPRSPICTSRCRSWPGLSVLAYLVIDRKFKIPRIGAYILLIVIGLVALASSPLMPKEATPLVPALQSYWLWLHVSVTMLGEAFFAVAFIASIMYLAAKEPEKKDKMDSVSYRCVAVGFPLFTLGGLVFGMVWAYKAWGTYWSWDPKEVWSLITWIVFALYLHTRIVMGWKGKRSAIIALVGFLAALFTYFGVNYLLAGLHSYA